jgi:hypothetical protein
MGGEPDCGVAGFCADASCRETKQVGTLLELMPVDVVDMVCLGNGTAFDALKSHAFLVEVERTHDDAFGQREIVGEPAKSWIVLQLRFNL